MSPNTKMPLSIKMSLNNRIPLDLTIPLNVNSEGETLG